MEIIRAFFIAGFVLFVLLEVMTMGGEQSRSTTEMPAPKEK